MVSVIIPNWNGRRHLKVCLESLRRQSYQDFEVILVDNGSIDGSVEFVKENFPEVKIVQFEKNRGFSAAVNAGIRYARGDYVALLNNDTEAHCDWLRELKAGFEEGDTVGFCASKVLFYDQRNIINSAGDAVSVTGYAWNIGRDSGDDGRFDSKKYVFGASAAASIYRSRMLEEIGLFDEDFFAYFEDVDLSFRAQLQGYQCLYLPKALIYHREGGGSRRYGNLALFYIERNALLNLVKNVPGPMLFRYAYTILLGHAHRFVVCLLKGRLPVWVSAKLSAFPYLFRFWKKRREVQKNRKVSLAYLSRVLEQRRVLWR